jgi:foldase protein PrsA
MSAMAGPLRRLVRSTLLGLLIGLTGCASNSPAGTGTVPANATPQPSSDEVSGVKDEAAAVVGGKPILFSQLSDRLIAGYGAEALREIMLREAVELEAGQTGTKVSGEELDRELRHMSEGYGSDNEFYISMQQQLGMDRAAVREEAGYRLLLEKLATREIQVSDSEIQGYYEEHQPEYGPRKEYQLSWILTGTKEEAASVLSRMESGEDFGQLAAEFSIDDLTADTGGDLGWVDEADPFQDPKILSAASQLQIGEAAGPLKIDQGYAVVELNGQKGTQARGLAAVKDEIRRLLALQQAKPMHELEQSLLHKYDAKVLDSRLSGALTR